MRREVVERAERLRSEIRRHDHLYYVLARPEISDEAYDRLFRELLELERAHPELVAPDSPTQRVGAPLEEGSGFRTVRHSAPMLSLESLFTEEEVREFDEKVRRFLGREAPVEYAVEPKLDGVSACLVYASGALVLGLTRGDGVHGEDITANLRAVRSIPLRLVGAGVFPARLEVRGEVLMRTEAFRALNERLRAAGEEPFANPRNAAAGTLKRLDPSIVAARELDFVAWGTGRCEGVAFARHLEAMEALRAWGIPAAPDAALCATIEDLFAVHRRLEAGREEAPFETDGVVAKVDSLALRQELGETARAPRWAFAFKFKARQATSRVRRIAVQVGRTGKLTPVALLDPVPLGGVTVKAATLHNADYVAAKDVREGDTVVLERAGDVIPAVVAVLPERRTGAERPFAMPERCPACGSGVEREGKFHRCPNPRCPEKIRGRVLHLAGRRALDIDRLGEKVVEQLRKEGLVREPADVFFLDRESLAALERWGEKSAANLLEQIDRAKRAPLDRFLFALGIPEVGEATAKILAQHFGGLEPVRAATESDLQAVHGIGPEMARAIRRFFDDPGERRFLDRLAEAGFAPQSAGRPGGPLSGKTFVFTGTLSVPREEAAAKVEARGGRVSSTLSSKTTYLVAGADPGSKVEKAKRWKVAILDEAAFRDLVSG